MPRTIMAFHPLLIEKAAAVVGPPLVVHDALRKSSQFQLNSLPKPNRKPRLQW